MKTLFPLAAALLLAAPVSARTISADPSNYRDRVPELSPGDVLELAAGDYEAGLRLEGLAGTPERWIVIRGPREGRPARFLGDPAQGRNTVEIVDSSYVAIEFLTIDGRDVPDVFAVSAKGGEANRTHHVRIEGCTIVGHGANQQTVAISTKCPTWGWIIRGNVIRGAGTGMYLGNSDGTCPFVAGVIEGNLVEDPVGYCLQVKHQVARPEIRGLPEGPQATILRHNVFAKSDRESPEGDRPNVLVGTFPESGAGSQDRYEIYGNLFLHNPRENLLQASGRVTIHDNLFVDGAGSAIYLTDHNGPLRSALVYHNTAYAVARGVSFGSRPRDLCLIAANLLFAETPIDGLDDASAAAGNVAGSVADAGPLVVRPGVEPGQFDFHPRRGQCSGRALDRSLFRGDADHDRDFDGRPKGDFRRAGAYATEGGSGTWNPAREMKAIPR